MEVEITFLTDKIEESFNKINCWRDQPYPFYYTLRSDYDKLYQAYQTILEEDRDHSRTKAYSFSSMLSLHKELKGLKEEMHEKIPSWCIPQEPVHLSEDLLDPAHFADFLYEFVQYLLALKEHFPEVLEEHTSTLYEIRKKIKRLIENRRDDFTLEQFWQKCIVLRKDMHEYDTKLQDLVRRYVEKKPGGEGGNLDVKKEEKQEDSKDKAPVVN